MPDSSQGTRDGCCSRVMESQLAQSENLSAWSVHWSGLRGMSLCSEDRKRASFGHSNRHNFNDSQSVRLLELPSEFGWTHGYGWFSLHQLILNIPKGHYPGWTWQLCEHCKCILKSLRCLMSCCPRKSCLLAFLQHVKGNGFYGLSMKEDKEVQMAMQSSQLHGYSLVIPWAGVWADWV